MAMKMDLYDDLLKKVLSNGIKSNDDENKGWISVINRLPDQLPDGSNPFEIIYALILHHFSLEEGLQSKTFALRSGDRSRLNGIPYGGKAFDHGHSQPSAGVLYTLPNLPSTLLQIIEQYINEIVIFHSMV